MVAAADQSALPLTDDQIAILNAFIASNFDLAATVESAGISLTELLAWHREPAVQAALNDFESLQARADELQLAAARRDAVKELHGILRSTDSDPIERRRAATALLRRNTARGIGFQPMNPGGTGGSPASVRPASGQAPQDTERSRSAADLQDLAISRSLAVLNASIDALEASATAAAAAASPPSSEISNLKSDIPSSPETPDLHSDVPPFPDPLDDPALTGDPDLRTRLARLLRAAHIDHQPAAPPDTT